MLIISQIRVSGSGVHGRVCPRLTHFGFFWVAGTKVQFLFADPTLDLNWRELRRGSTPIAVEPQVFDLLIYLVQNREPSVAQAWTKLARRQQRLGAPARVTISAGCVTPPC